MAALAASLGSHLLVGLLIGSTRTRSAHAGVALPIALVVTESSTKHERVAKPTVKAVQRKPKPRPARRPRPVRRPVPPVEPPPAEVALANEVLTPVEDEIVEPPVIEQDVPASQVNLGRAAPEGTRLSLVLRTDRLRGTDLAESVVKILEPMPDYRTLVSGTEIVLVDAFDVLVIATPDPRDVTATFLAARAVEPLNVIRTLLAGTSGRPRVTWSGVAGGMLGTRTRAARVWAQDPRVLLSVCEHWLLLSRPEHVATLTAPLPVAGQQPTPSDASATLVARPNVPAAALAAALAEPLWLAQLEAVARQTDAGNNGAPVAVIGFAGAGEVFSVPSVGPVRVPDIVTLAITAKPGGELMVEGTAVFPDRSQAATFVAAVAQGKAQTQSSIATRFLLSQFNLTSAVASLAARQQDNRVVLSAVLSPDDTQRLLILAAGWSRDWFETRMQLSRPSGQ